MTEDPMREIDNPLESHLRGDYNPVPPREGETDPLKGEKGLRAFPTGAPDPNIDPLLSGRGPDINEFGMSLREMEMMKQREQDKTFLAYKERSILLSTIHPGKVRDVMRSSAKIMEQAVTEAPGLEDRYEAINMYTGAKKRAEDLKRGSGAVEHKKDLAKAQYLKYDDEDEIQPYVLVTPIDEPDAPERPFFFRDRIDLVATPDAYTDERKLYDEQQAHVFRARMKDYEKKREVWQKNKERVVLAEANRKDLVKELENEAKLLVARSKFAFLYRTHEGNAGTIDKVAEEFLYPRMYHPQAEDFKALFDAEADVLKDGDREFPSELQNSPEIKKLGEGIDLAMRAYYVIGLTENPQTLRELKAKPGWKILFPTEADERRLLGNIDGWYAGVSSKDGKIQKTKTHTENYSTHPDRGGLSKFGNVYAREENADQMAELRATVRELAGEDAEEIAFRSMRMFGVAANMGSEYYWDLDKRAWAVQQEGFPQADDMVKIMNTREWHLKNDASGHPCGPKKTRGKYERLTTDFFSFTTADTPNGKRSFKEMWWGYSDEEAKRLGELPWNGVSKDVLNKWFLRVFYSARKGGFFDKMTMVAWDPKMAGAYDTWEQITKDTNILISDAVVANGWLKGKERRASEEADEWKLDFRGNIISIFEDPEERRQNMWMLREGGAGVEGEPGHTTLKNALKTAKYKTKA